jgi:hypothetical protein
MVSSFKSATKGDFRESIVVRTVDEVGRISVLADKLTSNLSSNFQSINGSVNGIEEAKDAPV